MSEYSKDDFTTPVEDYDFSTVDDVNSLIDQMGRAGGFTATKLAHARDVLSDAMAKSGQEGVLNWLSFPACLCATGTRGFFLEALKRKAFNVVITTCGTLDHDIARTYQDYFHGDFNLDDVALGEQGLNRLGNVIVPNECYGEIIEAVVLPWLEDIEAERTAEQSGNPWLGFGSVELCWAMGDRIEDEGSLLHWAAKHRIPIVIPGLSDGSIGSQLFMHRQKSPNFMVDFLADEQILSDLTWTAEESHALMVGGGISKHHVIWWNQYRGGLDSAVGITTAPEHDGSLSGARLREAMAVRGEAQAGEGVAAATSFGVRRMVAPRMRRDRILTVGDTAHEVSPIGGQGMNLGLLDAMTLAPLLAEWMRTGTAPTTLDAWERRRVRSARVSAAIAAGNTALGRPASRRIDRLRTGALRALLATPASLVLAHAYAMGFDADA